MNDLKCFFGMHQYEIIGQQNIQEEILGIPISHFFPEVDALAGQVIVSRCKHCGKIKHHKIYYANRYAR